MLPGVVATQPRFIPVGAPAPSGAVHFRGSTGPNGKCGIKLNALSCTNNGFLSWAGWFKNPTWTPTTGQTFPTAWIVDNANTGLPDWHRNGTTQWTVEYGTATREFGMFTDTSHLANASWIHVMGSVDVNQSASNKKVKLYVGDTDRTDLTGTDAGVAFTLAMNGQNFWLGDDGFGDGFVCDVYDFSFWPGVSFLTAGDISLTTRRLFIDGSGHPVAPSVAIASLGSPALMLTGGVAGFLANSLGTNGTLTVPAGFDSPTTASTSP